MVLSKGFKYLKGLLIGLCLGIIILGLTPTAAFAQTSSSASKLKGLCRQVNPSSTPGLVAFFSPNTTSPIKASDGGKDGPGVDEAIYLTSTPPEKSADGKFIRVWFKSLDPNYKLGWIEAKDDALKMGDNSWREKNCPD